MGFLGFKNPSVNNIEELIPDCQKKDTDKKDASCNSWMVSLSLIILFSLKSTITACVETAVLVSTLGDSLKIPIDDPYRVILLCKLIFALGLSNLAQCFFGLRSSLMLSPSFLLLQPIIFYLSAPEYDPSKVAQSPSIWDMFAFTAESRPLDCESRMHLVLGCLLIMSSIQLICSIPCFQSFVCRIISPIAVICVLLYLPISMLDTIVEKSAKNYAIALGTMAIFPIIAHQFPSFKSKRRATEFNLCTILAIPTTLTLVCITCYMGTNTASVAKLSTQSKIRIFNESMMESYVRKINYKDVFFDWRWPRFHWAALWTIVPFAMFTIPLNVEYYKSGNKVQGKKTLDSNLSKGLAVDALSCLFNVALGAIAIFQISPESLQDMANTKFIDRRIVILSGTLLLLAPLVTQFCVYLTFIPEPILGAFLCILCIQHVAGGIKVMSSRVDITRTKNLYVMLMSILMPTIIQRLLLQAENIALTQSNSVTQAAAIATLFDRISTQRLSDEDLEGDGDASECTDDERLSKVMVMESDKR